jgi:agmatinase
MESNGWHGGGEQLDERSIMATGIPTYMHRPFVKPEPDALREYDPDVVIVGAPFAFDCMVRPGSFMGPRSVRAASEWITPYHRYYNVDYAEEFRICDIGDVATTPNPERAAENFDYLEETIDMILEVGALPVVLGGDHSIPQPVQKAVCKRIEGHLGVLHFDSHLDNEEEIDGWRHGDASCAARALEMPKIRPENYCTIGPDSYSNPRASVERVRKQGHNVFWREDIYDRGIESVIQEAIDRASDGTEAVYFTFDIDVMDGTWCPASEMGPNVGGLTFREMLKAMRMIATQCRIRGFDVNCVGTELNLYGAPGISSNVQVAMIHEYLAATALKKAKGEDY